MDGKFMGIFNKGFRRYKGARVIQRIENIFQFLCLFPIQNFNCIVKKNPFCKKAPVNKFTGAVLTC